MQVLRLNTTESTNNYLKALSKDRALNNFAVISDEQTNGKGCGGKTFFSPKGGLYLSYTFRPDTSPEETVDITKWAAVAIWDALKEVFPLLLLRIKPVNDILLNGKKICGILTEYTGENLIIGVGINVNTEDFPDGIEATSFLLETGKATELRVIEKPILDKLELLYNNWPGSKDYYLSQYERHCR